MCYLFETLTYIYPLYVLTVFVICRFNILIQSILNGANIHVFFPPHIGATILNANVNQHGEKSSPRPGGSGTSTSSSKLKPLLEVPGSADGKENSAITSAVPRPTEEGVSVLHVPRLKGSLYKELTS